MEGTVSVPILRVLVRFLVFSPSSSAVLSSSHSSTLVALHMSLLSWVCAGVPRTYAYSQLPFVELGLMLSFTSTSGFKAVTQVTGGFRPVLFSAPPVESDRPFAVHSRLVPVCSPRRPWRMGGGRLDIRCILEQKSVGGALRKTDVVATLILRSSGTTSLNRNACIALGDVPSWSYCCAHKYPII
jgi:hypothetical protein